MSTTTHIVFSNPPPPDPSKKVVRVDGDSLIVGNVAKYEHSRPLFGRNSITVYLKTGEKLHYDGMGINDFLAVFSKRK